jgi:hypothetical protein
VVEVVELVDGDVEVVADRAVVGGVVARGDVLGLVAGVVDCDLDGVDVVTGASVVEVVEVVVVGLPLLDPPVTEKPLLGPDPPMVCARGAPVAASMIVTMARASTKVAITPPITGSLRARSRSSPLGRTAGRRESWGNRAEGSTRVGSSSPSCSVPVWRMARVDELGRVGSEDANGNGDPCVQTRACLSRSLPRRRLWAYRAAPTVDATLTTAVPMIVPATPK